MVFDILAVLVLMLTSVKAFRNPSSRRNLFLFERRCSSLFSNSNLELEKKKIVFLGTPSCAAESLEILANESRNKLYEIVAVVTQPPAPSGRKQKIQKSPVHELAEKLSILVLHPEKANNADFLGQLVDLSPDLCITAAYGNFLPSKFLKIPKLGTVNIHPSLLPKYRGAAPVQRCLENGDSKSGVTVLYTVLKMDAGPIIKQVECELDGHEQAPRFLSDMFKVGTQELIKALPSIFEGSVQVIEQDEEGVTHAPKLAAGDARLDFATINALVAHNKVRGYADWPGVWSTFTVGDEGNTVEPLRIKITTTVVLSPNADHATDDIIGDPLFDNAVTLVKHGDKMDVLRVRCGDGSVLGLVEVQPAGKKVMAAKAFVNGLRGANLRWISPPPPPPPPVPATTKHVD